MICDFSGYNSTHRYIHYLLVDHFTRYAYVVTFKYQTFTELKKILNLILKYDNKIKNLLAYHYAALNSNDFKNFVNQNDIIYYTAIDYFS